MHEVVYDRFGLEDISWGARAIFAQLKTRYIMRYNDDAVRRQKSVTNLLKRLSQAAKRLDAKLIVMHIPYLARGYTNAPPLELQHALNPDVIFIDLAPVISDYYRDANHVSLAIPLDGHPNPFAHMLMAHEIYKVLAEHNLMRVAAP